MFVPSPFTLPGTVRGLRVPPVDPRELGAVDDRVPNFPPSGFNGPRLFSSPKVDALK